MNFNNQVVYSNEESERFYKETRVLEFYVNRGAMEHENLYSSDSSKYSIAKNMPCHQIQSDHNSTNSTGDCSSPENIELFPQYEGLDLTGVTSSRDESTLCNSPVISIDIASSCFSPNLSSIKEDNTFNPPMEASIEKFALKQLPGRKAKKNPPKKVQNESDSEDDYKPVRMPKGAKKSSAPKKAKKQNKMKNFSGLIAQRVKTCLISGIGFGKAFMERLVEKLGEEGRKRFLKFLGKYEKQWKTWASIGKFVHSDEEMGQIFVSAIFEFLQVQNQEDFDLWVDGGKLKKENKELAKNSKDFFIKNFKAIQKGEVCKESEISESNEISEFVGFSEFNEFSELNEIRGFDEYIFEDEADEIYGSFMKKVKVGIY